MEKACKLCGNTFTPVGVNKTRQLYCTAKCQSTVSRKKYYELNPDKFFKKRSEWASNWEKKTICQLKSRAKRIGVPFDIDESDIQLVEFCPVLGIKIDRVFGTRGVKVGYRPTSPSVDRIVPEKGYTKGNVRVISNRANLLKSNAEVWELEKVLEDLKRCH